MIAANANPYPSLENILWEPMTKITDATHVDTMLVHDDNNSGIVVRVRQSGAEWCDNTLLM